MKYTLFVLKQNIKAILQMYSDGECRASSARLLVSELCAGFGFLPSRRSPTNTASGDLNSLYIRCIPLKLATALEAS